MSEEELTFHSPDPTPRPFPHSNRRLERVARQKRDLAQQEEDDIPVRHSLKRAYNIKKMAGVRRTPTKNSQQPPPPSGAAPEGTPMDTDGAGEGGFGEIKSLIMRLDNKLDKIDDKMGDRLDKLESNMEDRFVKVSEDIDDLKDRVARNEDELESKIQKVINKQPGSVRGADIEKPIDKALTEKFKSSRAFLRQNFQSGEPIGRARAEKSRESVRDCLLYTSPSPRDS